MQRFPAVANEIAVQDQAAAGARPGAGVRAFWHGALRRVGFWRAMLELSLISNLVFVLPYAGARRLGSPWLELLSYLGMAVYVYAAWRLEEGRGGLLRRVARVLSWLLIYVLINGLAGWLAITYLPTKGRFLGIRLDELNLTLGAYLVSAGFVIGSVFLSARLLLATWGLGTRRLRWRLTFSYLLIGVLTFFLAPITLLLYLAVASLFVVPTLAPPRELAPQLAAALAPTAVSVSPGQLNALLAGIFDGSTRLPLPAGEELAEVSDIGSAGVRRLTLVSPDGTVLASAGREPFAVNEPLPPEAGLDLLLRQPVAPGGCIEGYPADGLVPDTAACPLGDGSTATLIVESNLDSSAQVGAAFGRVVQLTLLGTSLLLNLAAFVVLALLPISLGVGYLLARGLTRRIERLDAAASGLASGRLDSRVAADSQDEIGRLGATFNIMAAQLQERERALAETAARAEALLRANKRLVADVSHELRNPLATLHGYLEALDQEHGATLPRDDMRVIRGEMARLTALVEDLFTLARVEAQQLPLRLGPVDAGALVRGLADTLAPLARREREIELLAQVAPGLPQALADPGRLEQVLRNLAQNALRHTPPGGIIAFEATPGPDASVVITVADTGVGIEPDDLPHVFERFYRGDSSRARETGGAGLGLALVRELVAAMGGTVSVESTPGRGSRFTVVLRQAPES
ncbi:MAG: hypothetical protein OHK0015_33680 [Chloroflexi bacterium OHK40]